MNRGSSTTEPLVYLAVILVIIFLMAINGGGLNNQNQRATTTNTTNNSYSFINQNNQNNSSAVNSRSIYISTGNAAYAVQSYEEYITISNSGRESVDITGWQLRNGKNQRAYDVSGSLQYFAQDVAIIPQGTFILSPYGLSLSQNIVLKPGETAIITTGQMGQQAPFRITSFKENRCTAYIENLDEYNFTPSLNYNCPRPADEPGVTGLDTQCRQYIERMQSCHTPEFNTRDNEGNICTNCVDGKPLSSSCVAFIKSHFSYQGCLVNHAGDKDFSLNTWRIFLGRGWEMWAQKYERIELFDSLGRLINYKEY